MNPSEEKRSARLLTIGIIIGILGLAAGPALAALTFSGTGVTGDGAVVVDGPSTISIGTSTATGVTIGNGSSTISLMGNVGIGKTAIIGSTNTGSLDSFISDLAFNVTPAIPLAVIGPSGSGASPEPGLLLYGTAPGEPNADGPYLWCASSGGTWDAPTDSVDNGANCTLQSVYFKGGHWVQGSAYLMLVTSDVTNGGGFVEMNALNVDAGGTFGGNVGIGTTVPSTTLQVAGSSTIRIGAGSIPGCLELMDSSGNGTINYLTAAGGVLAATTTKPAACQ